VNNIFNDYSLCEGCPARSKAMGLGPIIVGFRVFESHLSHHLFYMFVSKSHLKMYVTFNMNIRIKDIVMSSIHPRGLKSRGQEPFFALGFKIQFVIYQERILFFQKNISSVFLSYSSIYFRYSPGYSISSRGIQNIFSGHSGSPPKPMTTKTGYPFSSWYF
jgi:hypothetical protein